MNRKACRTKSLSSQMIIGDPSVFAIESGIMQAYEQLGLRALGFFVIHIMGKSYGIKEPDAAHLANSFDEVSRRVTARGNHMPPFPVDAEAAAIALAYYRSVYAECEEQELFFGMTDSQFSHSMHQSGLVWAPDGEAAFDDGSYVLQFDHGSQVRLIAFRSKKDYSIDSIRDLWLPASDFYGVLEEWRDRFEADWKAHPKEPAHVTIFPCR
jgi:Immunity protein 42